MNFLCQQLEKKQLIGKDSARLKPIHDNLGSHDFSRIQSGRMKLIKEKLDILAEFDDAVYFLKERAVTEGKHLLYDEPAVSYTHLFASCASDKVP